MAEIKSKFAQKTPEERNNRRRAVLNWMEKVGPFSLPAAQLAKEHSCDITVIYKDREYIIKRMKLDDMNTIGKKTIMTVQKNLAVGEEIRIHPDVKVRLGAITTINQSAETVTRLLEQYGFKEKIADIQRLEGMNATFNLITKSVEEIKDAKDRSARARLGDKPEARGNTKSS